MKRTKWSEPRSSRSEGGRRLRLGALLLLTALGAVAALPVAETASVPLADLELVAEHSAPPAELGARNQNGTNENHNANTGSFGGWAISTLGGFGGPVAGGPPPGRGGDLVAVALH